MLRAAFFGCDNSSLSFIEFLNKYTDLKLVVTRPAKPSGRGLKLKEDVVKIYCDENKIPAFMDMNIDLNVDVAFLHSFGKKVPVEILNKPKYGFFNIHFSLLPKYRGASPVETAILMGEQTSGVTIFKMNERIDEGDILLQKEVEIENRDYLEVEALMIEAGLRLLRDAVDIIESGNINLTPQRGNPSYTRRIKKEDGFIDFRIMESIEIYRKYLAFKKWPGIFTTYKGKRVVFEKINHSNLQGRAAEVMGINPFMVGCKTGSILIELLKVEGRSVVKGNEFVNGYRIKPGESWVF